jgi:hypothetical protein
MTRVDIDRVPSLARPAEVGALLDEAVALRDRLRAASEALASAEAKLGQAKHADALAASERLRRGGNVGSEQPAVQKARNAVEAAKRAERAAELAAGAVAVDAVETIRANSPAWLDELEAEQAQARDRALAALATFEHELAAIREAAGAAGWLRASSEDGRYDRAPRLPLVGSAAPSSAKRTGNAEALRSDEVIAYARELVEPAPAPVAIVEPATSDTT